MTKKLIIINRKDLYNKVWNTPISHLASEYGISDVALAKICKKLNVPRPSRGYWTKLQFGKKVTKPPLPEIGPNDRKIYEIYDFPKEKKKFRKGAIEIGNVIPKFPSNKALNVSKRLVSPHSLVEKTKQFLIKQKADEYGILPCWRRKCLDIRVSPYSLNRALRIMDAIIKTFESIGIKVVIESNDTQPLCTYVEIQGIKIPFYIKEKTKRIDHIPTAEEIESQKKWEYDKPRSWDFIPTGKLFIKIDAWEDSRARKKWSDTSSKKIEEQIRNFAESTFVVAEFLRKNRIKQEEERVKLEERWKIEQEEEARREADEERFRQLEIEAEQWAKSQQLRKYIETIEKISAHPKCSDELKEKINNWAKWAKEHVNKLDPLTCGMPFGFDPYDSEK